MVLFVKKLYMKTDLMMGALPLKRIVARQRLLGSGASASAQLILNVIPGILSPVIRVPIDILVQKLELFLVQKLELFLVQKVIHAIRKKRAQEENKYVKRVKPARHAKELIIVLQVEPSMNMNVIAQQANAIVLMNGIPMTVVIQALAPETLLVMKNIPPPVMKTIPLPVQIPTMPLVRRDIRLKEARVCRAEKHRSRVLPDIQRYPSISVLKF